LLAPRPNHIPEDQDCSVYTFSSNVSCSFGDYFVPMSCAVG